MIKSASCSRNSIFSTLRELYYISENWDIAKFREQPESDRLIEDLEIISGLQREYFHMRPEEDGATMFGPIKIREETNRGDRMIHCQEDIGESGYQIPFNVENIEFLEHSLWHRMQPRQRYDMTRDHHQ